MVLLSSLIYLLARHLAVSGHPLGSRVEPVPCASDPNTRSLYTIISSCLFTVFACTWVSAHPNVPSPNQGILARFWHRFRLMLVALIAPELIAGFAARQFLDAWWFSKKYKVSMTHGFFFAMGGFASADGHHPIVTQEQLDEHPEYLTTIRSIGEGFIEDKSKGDAVSKGLALLQGGWFIVQCLARYWQHLPLTGLEVATLAFQVASIFVWLIWWYKPLDAREPILLYPSDEFVERTRTLPDARLHPSDVADSVQQPLLPMPSDVILDRRHAFFDAWPDSRDVADSKQQPILAHADDFGTRRHTLSDAQPPPRDVADPVQQSTLPAHDFVPRTDRDNPRRNGAQVESAEPAGTHAAVSAKPAAKPVVAPAPLLEPVLIGTTFLSDVQPQRRDVADPVQQHILPADDFVARADRDDPHRNSAQVEPAEPAGTHAAVSAKPAAKPVVARAPPLLEPVLIGTTSSLPAKPTVIHVATIVSSPDPAAPPAAGHAVVPESQTAPLAAAKPALVRDPEPEAKPAVVPASRTASVSPTGPKSRVTRALDTVFLGWFSTFDPNISNSVPWFWSTHGQCRPPHFWMGISVIIEFLIGAVFGFIHLVAWNTHFPSADEMQMWRSCSLVVASLPLVLLCLHRQQTALERFLGSTGVIKVLATFRAVAIRIAILAYIFARLILITLSFTTLRALPPGAFVEASWTTYIPHL
ncbi:hypothetical protein K438DRAFT_1719594 [Mycena galopus ATCC 62051]|nr:hypothetical protein K438DRAFT_1719594 [Mycena galopus ATCC 62051]